MGKAEILGRRVWFVDAGDLGICGLSFGFYAGCAGSGGAGRKIFPLAECPC